MPPAPAASDRRTGVIHSRRLQPDAPDAPDAQCDDLIRFP